MNGIFLIIPILLIRFGLLNIINKEALKQAAYFPPCEGKEKVAFWVYQITNTFMIVYLLFVKIEIKTIWSYLGLSIYLLGLVLYAISIIDFAKPKENRINLKGLYKISRNPMYVAYFFHFLGCGLLINSLAYFIILIVFQISVHWIILSEERWCIKEFGEEYKEYMNKVGRYLCSM